MFYLSIYDQNNNSFPFLLRANGWLHAENVELTGKIYANEGTVGGWEITQDSIRSFKTADYQVGICDCSNENHDFIFIYNYSSNKFPFVLRADGWLHAENADITGVINATSGHFKGKITSSSGSIGGWTIAGSYLESANSKVHSYLKANGNVLFGGDYGIINFDNNPVRINTASKMIISDNYNNSSLGKTYATIGIYADHGWLHLASENVTINDTQYGGTSSLATKKNIKILTESQKEEVYNIIRNLNSYSYDYKSKYSGLKNNYGFIIEDFENTILGKILHCVQNDRDKNKKSYSHEDLTCVNTIIIQELIKKIERLEEKLCQ